MEHEWNGPQPNLTQSHGIHLPPASPRPGRDIQIVPIDRLISADSPRLNGLDEEHVARLTEMDTTLPPILVHRATMRVIDGMHRLRAASLRGKREIHVELFDGSEEEAFIQGVKANVVHGLPLPLPDRRAAAVRILATHPQLSDRAIGAYTGLAHKTVSALRNNSSSGDDPQLSKRMGADGRVRPVSSQDGRRRAAEIIAERPGASLREIAACSGVSVGTAHDVRKRIRRGEGPVPILDRHRPSRDQPKFSTPQTPPPSTEQLEHLDRHADRNTVGDVSSMLHSLLRDPSVKRTDAGRALLQWLHLHIIRKKDWTTLVEAVPAHRLQSVAALARHCGRLWFEFAHELETRDQLNASTERDVTRVPSP